MLRVSIGAQATEREHVQTLWDELRRAAAAAAVTGAREPAKEQGDR